MLSRSDPDNATAEDLHMIAKLRFAISVASDVVHTVLTEGEFCSVCVQKEFPSHFDNYALYVCLHGVYAWTVLYYYWGSCKAGDCLTMFYYIFPCDRSLWPL